MSDAETPLISHHAASRWDERTPDDSVAPEKAWRHGQTIRAGGPFRTEDEIRYHRETGTLLLRKASVVETVYDVEKLTSPAYNAVKHALPERGRA